MGNELWIIEQECYDVKDNPKYETIFTLANGYRGFRGWLEFSSYGFNGNFIAGVFDKAEAQVTEIVNTQNPLVFNLYVDDERIDIDRCEIVNFKRYLDMKDGILHTDIEIKTPKGKITKISAKRFVSRKNVHRWGVEYKITPINYSGKIFVENMIDGTVTNGNYHPVDKTKHIRVKETYDLNPGIALEAHTIDQGIRIIEGTIIKVLNDTVLKNRKYGVFGEIVRELLELRVEEGKEYILQKFGATYTSRDTDDNLIDVLENELRNFYKQGLEDEIEAHIKAWQEIWDRIDIEIKGDVQAQLGIRFNIFQLSSSAYDQDDRVSIAAKALHGEGYKGHVFWDTEIFMLPFFIYTQPEIARNLLMYRYNTLDGARKNAKLNGYEGAQFPWESADDGLEVTPKWGMDYDGNLVRIWTGDEEFHINSDIVFSIWEYYRATKDKDFLMNYGMEILLETAKFWISRVEYNIDMDRYEINKVIGPDEFHEHVNNNFYTNYLAKWNIEKTLELAEWLKRENVKVYEDLLKKLDIKEEDFKEWKVVKDKIYIPYSEDGKLIEQFEGYFDLKDIEITEHDENGMPLWPDLQGYKLGQTQLIKQPDVVMLMLLLGDEFDKETRKINYEYYEKRTMHKSSLSPSMYSIMGLTVGDTHNAYKYFMKTILTDLEDNQGNACFGLHAASTGGSWQSVVFGFGGLHVDKEQYLCLNPWIPEHWDELTFNIIWNEAKVKVVVSHNEVRVISTKDFDIKIYDEKFKVYKNKELIYRR
ncbi:kojibiose phosphorylase [Caloranaerobacter sp. TR13]|uniref:glycoside hydrolase family 65 protein n=1 Tax=Caloranaerobacter sp. TR13 TaxID=1302151 RepID=UPI0006D3E56A|nr:glycosyl hydrolase family 65 protein [Caloranaerobacter sp. TR13]KPU26848.1 kojibiose phosphorylase [Caloranaerobacter sp. TR13]